jgi:hypothetical protein
LLAWQAPSASQYSLAAHSPSLAHAEHWALAPVQLSGAVHAGEPGEPAGKSSQTPSVAAPAATEQTSQDPPQAVSQQRSSAQRRLPQSGAAVQGPP